MGKRQRIQAGSRDGRDDLLCTKPWPRRAKLSLAGSTIPAMVDHIRGKRCHEAGSRDAHLRLTQGG